MSNDELLTYWAIRIAQAVRRDPISGEPSSPENLQQLRSRCISTIGLTAATNIWNEAATAADLAIFGEKHT